MSKNCKKVQEIARKCKKVQENAKKCAFLHTFSS